MNKKYNLENVDSLLWSFIEKENFEKELEMANEYSPNKLETPEDLLNYHIDVTNQIASKRKRRKKSNVISLDIMDLSVEQIEDMFSEDQIKSIYAKSQIKEKFGEDAHKYL